MKKVNLLILFLLGLGLGSTRARAQGFSSGSDGSSGALSVTVNTTLDVPASGIFNFTTITVAQNTTLSFNHNALNTPVYLLATGDVVINGVIDVSAKPAPGNAPVGAFAGPGGFDGGMPGLDPSAIPPGAGYGPGAGKGGAISSQIGSAGAGGYGSAPNAGSSTNHGGIYGSPLLIPLVGGSGGGGTAGSPGVGGGGGGGAILIASSTKISVNNGSRLLAQGSVGGGAFNGGSGGAIRLVAPMVAGGGEVNVYGQNAAGFGRVRIDTLNRTGLSLNFQPAAAASIGAAMFIFPNPLPRLDIVEAAGTAIAEGTPNPVIVVLPFGSNPARTVKLQARDFSGIVPVNLVLTPENGGPTAYPAQIDMSAGNPASTTVNVTFPVNVRTVVSAWTR